VTIEVGRRQGGRNRTGGRWDIFGSTRNPLAAIGRNADGLKMGNLLPLTIGPA
jgi:hypothetical protein